MTALTAAPVIRLAVRTSAGKLRPIGRAYASYVEARAAAAVVARVERMAWRREPVAMIEYARGKRVSQVPL